MRGHSNAPPTLLLSITMFLVRNAFPPYQKHGWRAQRALAARRLSAGRRENTSSCGDRTCADGRPVRADRHCVRMKPIRTNRRSFMKTTLRPSCALDRGFGIGIEGCSGATSAQHFARRHVLRGAARAPGGSPAKGWRDQCRSPCSCRWRIAPRAGVLLHHRPPLQAPVVRGRPR